MGAILGVTSKELCLAIVQKRIVFKKVYIYIDYCYLSGFGFGFNGSAFFVTWSRMDFGCNLKSKPTNRKKGAAKRIKDAVN